MDHIATSLGMDPLEFRMSNLLKPGDFILSDETATFEGPNRIPELISKLKQECDFEARQSEVLAFNKVCQANRSLFLRGVLHILFSYSFFKGQHVEKASS